MEKCPNCGYVDRPTLNLPSNVMNVYVQNDNPKNDVIVNSTKDSMVINGKTYTRKDLFQAKAIEGAPAPNNPPAPSGTTQSTPPVTKTTPPAAPKVPAPVNPTTK